MPSDVNVFVRFKDRSVFAGEELNCVITFKNAASTPDILTSSGVNRGNPRHVVVPSGPSTRKASHSRVPSRAARSKTRHQASFSLSNPPPPKNPDQDKSVPKPETKHQRSVSIVSIGSHSLNTNADKYSAKSSRGQSPALGHRRSSTVQHIGNVQRRPSPARHFSNDLRVPTQNGRRSPLSNSQTSSTRDLAEPVPDFKFPPDSRLNASTPESGQGTPILAPRHKPSHRAVSSTSQATGPRESMDIYSHSNNSQETFMSEQPSLISDKPQLSHSMARPIFRPDSTQSRRPEAVVLLMGYAQVGATFTLDPSLVDQTPFDEVKKKGFLGGQAGGGVVGVKKKARPSSSLFGSFGFSSIGESLENIMGGDNLSSVKEMKAVTNSRAIPLLSTPQSLLFVDLHLEPGEEKNFSFSFKVPRGLPSSYRGKAIKVVYNLTIGVQGAPGNKEMQAVRQVNVPIRVFSGVDSDGEIFGHDLMQPYVILKDMASARAIDVGTEDFGIIAGSPLSETAATDKFLTYVDNLLDKSRRRQSSTGTIDAMFGAFAPDKPAAMRAIDRAIMLSNQITASSESSPNRFEIARNGAKIATVILDRPLHRLGEVVTTAIDFCDSQMTCTSLRATLESAERVSDSLAVRSASAISRITKKVYASRSENVLFADRAVFCPTIPVNAAPTFVTSGVNLEWYIKLEFGTMRSRQDGQQFPNLLEEVIEDERGSVNIAVESLECDTFEVLIPITVYGDILIDGKEGDDVIGMPI